MSLYQIAMGDTDDDIQTVKARYTAELMAQPGVVSVGIGLGKDGRPAIIVGVESPDLEIERTVPTKLEGHPVVVRVIGRVGVSD